MDKQILPIGNYPGIEATPEPERETIESYTWEQLVAKFPVLQEIYDYFAGLEPELRGGELYFCANESERRVVTKKMLRDLMRDWTTRSPDNCQVFWRAYNHIWEAQPGCINCGCIYQGDTEAMR